MNNRQRLIDLMAAKGLDRMQIADLLRVKRDTVDHWLLPNESRSRVEIPDMAIELLELKLAAREASEPGDG